MGWIFLSLFISLTTSWSHAEDSFSYEGKEFVLAFTPPGRNETGQLYIMNKYHPTTCTVHDRETESHVNLNGFGQTIHQLEERFVQETDKGIRVHCKVPVQIYVYFGDVVKKISSASPIIPVRSLSTEHSQVMGPYSILTIVSTSNFTSVAIDLGTANATMDGEFFQDNVQFDLNYLEVKHVEITTNFLLYEREITKITSNTPIVVLSGYLRVRDHTTQTLHQILPDSQMVNDFALQVSHKHFYGSHLTVPNWTSCSIYGDAPANNVSVDHSLLNFMEPYDNTTDWASVIFYSCSSPISLLMLVSYHPHATFTTVIPGPSQHGHDYWIPSIQPNANVTMEVTLITYPECKSHLGFAGNWRDEINTYKNISMATAPLDTDVSRLTTDPTCPFAVQVTYLTEDGGFRFFAVPIKSEESEDQVATLKSLFNVTCDLNAWSIEMDVVGFQQSFPSSNISNIYLSNAFCSASRTGDIIKFDYSYSECKTRHMKNETDDIFSNYLVEYGLDQETHIAEEVIWRYDITCVRSRQGADSIAFSPVDDTTGIQVSSTSKVKGHIAEIKFFSDDSFTNETGGNPLAVAVGSRVFVEVASTAEDDVKLVVENCYVSPDKDSNNPNAVCLIRDRCESNRFVHILGSSDKMTRFYFDVFEIPHADDSIFVTCDVSFCDVMDFSYECQQDCQVATP